MSGDHPTPVKANPLPMRQFLPVTLILLNESICQTILLSVVAFLVAHIRGTSQDSSGFFSGFMIGAFMAGQVISAQFWGWISDSYGRRFPLIIGTLVSGFMMLGFGLSTNLWCCVLFRLLHGLFSGNVHIAKTIIADVTDKTNVAKGFSFISATFSIGFMIGPVIGSFFYDPANSSFFGVFGLKGSATFTKCPALLMSLFVLVYSLVCTVLCVVLVQESNPNCKPLPETVKKIFFFMYYPSEPFVKPPLPEGMEEEKKPEEEENEEKDAEAGKEDANSDEREEVKEKTESTTADTNAEKDNEKDSGEDRPFTPPGMKREDERTNDAEEQEERIQIVLADDDESKPKKDSFGYMEAFKLLATRYMLVQYMILCGADMIMRECFPLLAASSVAAGGLGYSKDGIAIILMINSFPTLISNILFSWFSKRYLDQMQLFRIGAAVAGALIFLLTLCTYIPSGGISVVLIVLCTSTAAFFTPFCYSVNTMCMARSAPKEHVGAVLAINQSSGAVVRAVTPIIGSIIFAWSISGSHIYPFNQAFVFVISALLYFFLWWRSFSIRTNDDMTLQIL